MGVIVCTEKDVGNGVVAAACAKEASHRLYLPFLSYKAPDSLLGRKRLKTPFKKAVFGGTDEPFDLLLKGRAVF